MSIENGGPAFPTVNYAKPGGDYGVSIMTISGGMTLRDYFAAKAMQGMLAAAENYSTPELAGYAYDCANAMLKAREVQP